MKYVYITKKGKVIVKDLKTQKQAYDYRWTIKDSILVWDKASGVMSWMARYKPKWLTNALIKANGKYIK